VRYHQKRGYLCLGRRKVPCVTGLGLAADPAMAKYLFITAQEGHRWGGSERLWSHAAACLVRAGNEVRISAKAWDKPVPQIEQLRKAGCKVFLRRYDLPSFIPRQFQKLTRKFVSPSSYYETQTRALGADVDLVIVASPDNATGLEWMEAARSVGRRYAIIAQSAVVYWWPNDDLAERLAKAYESSSASYFVSQAILDITRSQLGTSLQNSSVVRNPFNVNYNARPPWPADEDNGLALAVVGRLDVISKGHDLLLQVLALPHWRKRDVRVSLFGEGPNERGLRRMVKQLNLSNVTFCGASNDIEKIWSRHHALALPSRFEGMPLVVIEAMLCGRPCIATDVGGNRELIRDDANGFLAKAPTVELFDEAMNRAWENRFRLEGIGQVAARDVREWISPDPGGDLARTLQSLASGGMKDVGYPKMDPRRAPAEAS
jgi:glycosyltransferase involved in cell wall biosynthesis